MFLLSSQVRVTLTNDPNKIFKALQSVEPKGDVNFITGIRIAHVRDIIGPHLPKPCAYGTHSSLENVKSQKACAFPN